ncbi:hypothetical protein KIN20_018733 [Parelaphostrongylus tenuis]|uniref:Uncharacterized protein n=1 Tax=Parelaphostrongylus tenuis TaxID=148309 RepID=A0AAD5QPT8_PARTN|nr:hypothetical protein KIN20_018733 [Parelaphostrongylus tenuis]
MTFQPVHSFVHFLKYLVNTCLPSIKRLHITTNHSGEDDTTREIEEIICAFRANDVAWLEEKERELQNDYSINRKPSSIGKTNSMDGNSGIYEVVRRRIKMMGNHFIIDHACSRIIFLSTLMQNRILKLIIYSVRKCTAV